jgi:hypothetical protein
MAQFVLVDKSLGTSKGRESVSAVMVERKVDIWRVIISDQGPITCRVESKLLTKVDKSVNISVSTSVSIHA